MWHTSRWFIYSEISWPLKISCDLYGGFLCFILVPVLFVALPFWPLCLTLLTLVTVTFTGPAFEQLFWIVLRGKRSDELLSVVWGWWRWSSSPPSAAVTCSQSVSQTETFFCWNPLTWFKPIVSKSWLQNSLGILWQNNAFFLQLPKKFSFVSIYLRIVLDGNSKGCLVCGCYGIINSGTWTNF